MSSQASISPGGSSKAQDFDSPARCQIPLGDFGDSEATDSKESSLVFEIWKVAKLEGFKIVGVKIFLTFAKMLGTVICWSGGIEVTSAPMQSAIQSYLEAA